METVVGGIVGGSHHRNHSTEDGIGGIGLLRVIITSPGAGGRVIDKTGILKDVKRVNGARIDAKAGAQVGGMKVIDGVMMIVTVTLKGGENEKKGVKLNVTLKVMI